MGVSLLHNLEIGLGRLARGRRCWLEQRTQGATLSGSNGATWIMKICDVTDALMLRMTCHSAMQATLHDMAS